MITYPLRVGSITFDKNEFDGPNGNEGGLGDLGTKQKAVVREFAGGIVTAQLFGAFPKLIKWSGKLFGQNAIPRSLQLKNLCASGDYAPLSWADFEYMGFVEEFNCNVMGPHQIHYELIYRPLEDLAVSSNSLSTGQGTLSLVNNAQSTMMQQATSPAAGVALPPSVQSGTAQLDQSISQAVQNSGGSISSFPSSTNQTLQGQIEQIRQTLDPLVTGRDPLLSSAAADLSGTLGLLSRLFGSTAQRVIATLRNQTTPDLYQLSAQYYGTPTLYKLIQDANGLQDPYPILDEPVDLIIPALQDNVVSINKMVVRDVLAA